MRKLLLLFGVFAFFSLSLISCSDDDDGSTDALNRNIYGTWETDYRVDNGTFVEGSNLCNEKLEYNFSSNGNYTLKTFTGENPEDCLEDAQNYGNWEYLGDDKYLIHGNNVTITDANRDQYTFHLDFRSGNELRWYTLSDYNNSVNTFIVLKK